MEKETKNYGWCVLEDTAISLSNKTQDEVHNNHCDTESFVGSAFLLSIANCVNIIMFAQWNVVF